MATEKQKAAARRNIKNAQQARRSSRAGRGEGMSAAKRNDLPDAKFFAFPRHRKEPLSDAARVRNAIARFDQVEGVTDAERAQAWKRITAAAERFGIEVSERNWRELMRGGKSG
jgi:hypothetical protein